jgi:hypothetical protein
VDICKCQRASCAALAEEISRQASAANLIAVAPDCRKAGKASPRIYRRQASWSIGIDRHEYLGKIELLAEFFEKCIGAELSSASIA